MHDKIRSLVWSGCGLFALTSCADSLYGIGDQSYVEGVEVCAQGRYVVLDLGTDGCGDDGTGLVKDTTTGLTWMRHCYYPSGGQTQAEAASYCTSKGMRLPTKDEALAIAGTNYDSCAFPCSWYTWTSTPFGTGQAWGVGKDGRGYEDAVGISHHVVCVR